MELGKAIRHPATAATGLVSVVAGILQFPIVVDLGSWLIQSSGTLFTAASIFGFTIAPNVEWLPTSVLEPVAIALGVIYASYRLYGAGKSLRSDINE